MHPIAVQFGLSRGVLQLGGEEVLLSDALLEAISIEAQLWVALRKPPIQGNFLVDMTVRAAEKILSTQLQGTQKEIVPFFASLNRTMYYTLCRVAERSGIAHKEPQKLMTNPAFWAEFSERAADIKMKPAKSVAKIQKSMFKVCRDLTIEYYLKNDPDNERHAALTALFMFNFWNATGLLPMTQAVLILGGRRS